MAKRKSGYSKKTTDFFGRPVTEHFNSKGQKTGHSKQGTNFFGTPRTERFNAKGEKTGYSKKSTNLWGTPIKEHFNTKGEKTGYSKKDTDLLGSPVMNRYAVKGEKIGQSRVGSTLFGTPIVEHFREAKPSTSGYSGSPTSSAFVAGELSSNGADQTKSSGAGWVIIVAIAAVIILIASGAMNRLVNSIRQSPAQASSSAGVQAHPVITNFGGRVFQPVDEAPKDASFLEFRNKLVAAVEAKDTAYLLSITSPEVAVGFGGEPNTVEEFAKEWKLDSPDSEFWDVFGKVISLGGAFQTFRGQRQFCAPYVTGSWPVDVDSFEYAAIIAGGVRLRAQPDQDASILGGLSFNLVKIEEWTSDRTWAKVTTDNGVTGYVSGKYVRSPIDYRAFFQQVDGRWQLTAFVAGD